MYKIELKHYCNLKRKRLKKIDLPCQKNGCIQKKTCRVWASIKQ